MPQLVNHLKSFNFVVNTWAAHCIERILAMKNGSVNLFSSLDIQPFQQDLLESLLTLIVRGKTPVKIAENEYLIKCLLRIIMTSREGLAPVAPMLLERLTFIITQISQNPSNPHFNHFAFESLSSIVKFLCKTHPALVQAFEKSLGNPFEDIVRREVAEFTPYVFQIYAQLLELHTGGIPPQYMTLLTPLLQPNFWNNPGNVPALVNFLSAFLSRGFLRFLTIGSKDIIQAGQLQSFLGVYQKLLSSKFNDQFAFELLKAIFEFVPQQHLQPFMKNCFVLAFTRLFQHKTAKLTQTFVDFLVHSFNIMDPQIIITEINSIQQE